MKPFPKKPGTKASQANLISVKQRMMTRRSLDVQFIKEVTTEITTTLMLKYPV
jgi:hypothetical protein